MIVVVCILYSFLTSTVQFHTLTGRNPQEWECINQRLDSHFRHQKKSRWDALGVKATTDNGQIESAVFEVFKVIAIVVFALVAFPPSKLVLCMHVSQSTCIGSLYFDVLFEERRTLKSINQSIK